MEAVNFFSKNIRFLRRARQWSQEELAVRLGVNRSNIAAYESKNVEPRLALALEIARLFGVGLTELIQSDLEADASKNKPFEGEESEGGVDNGAVPPNASNIDQQALREYVQRSISIRKMLEGFRIFYELRREKNKDEDPSSERALADIDNFTHLIDHMLALNESLADLLSKLEN
ncbi:MAG: helix-turn-helix transcriptional regulator [Phaeodactylibacter sp.]|nr:helix-turn-helix transcriptional regulator [Phaeodactylibacter sp.]MCB9300513.1 helix-turn-helix transcriptional regulator [Lewinellaceae bacterium]HQU58343.1 helix-turn-helix transcriptional regulator [Saprospiraceae bacterium]